MPESINNPIIGTYGELFSSQDSIVNETNDVLAPLMMKKISALGQIKIKNVRIIEHNIKKVDNFMTKYIGNIHSEPYHLGNMVVEVNVGNISKPITVDVALAVFYDKIDNYQLNSTGFVSISDLNIDFIVNDYNRIKENKFLVMIKDAQANLTIWDFLKIVVPDMSFQMFKKMKDAIDMMPKLREDIVKYYKYFQLTMTTLYENEGDIEQQNEKIYKPVLAAIAMKRKKAYMDSDIFYFDVGERNRDDIIHASPYGRYFKNEFGIYENGRSLVDHNKGIEKYIGELIIDIGCGTGEKAQGLIKRIDELQGKNQRCYIGFDTNPVAIYDANYNMNKGAFVLRENEEGVYEKIKENETIKEDTMTYLFSEGMLSDLNDGTIKFLCLDNVEPNMSILQKESVKFKVDKTVVKRFTNYKDVFFRDDAAEKEKEEIIYEIEGVVKEFISTKDTKLFKKMQSLYHEQQQKSEVKVDIEHLKKISKTILVPGGTFGNFMQDDPGLAEYIQKLEYQKKNIMYKVQRLKQSGRNDEAYDRYIQSMEKTIEELKQKNNSQRMFLGEIKKTLHNKTSDFALLTVFTQPSKDDKEYFKKTRAIEKIYNNEAFKEKYISLFRKMGIEERDLEYFAKYEKDDKIHIYVRVKNPKGIFFPFIPDKKMQIPLGDDDIVRRKGIYVGVDLPIGFTFHCQASKRFTDEDMYAIVEDDGNGGPTGLKIVDQIIDPECEDMKIFVIGTSEIDSK